MEVIRPILYSLLEYFLGLLRITLTTGGSWILELYSDSLNALIVYSIRGLEFTGTFVTTNATNIFKYLLENGIQYVLDFARYCGIFVIETFIQSTERILNWFTNRFYNYATDIWE